MFCILKKAFYLLLFTICGFIVRAQRNYKPHSVLATGAWYKIAVEEDGIYKLDVPFLTSLGMAGNIPSANIQVFTTGGAMLPEANSEPRIDDLEEVAISVNDGGDGVLNGSDYILFFGQSPHHWVKDSANRRFTYQKNLYSDKTYYYITVGNAGKRVTAQQPVTTTGTIITSYDERIAHEKDSVNFLSSGKQWYGEEFSDAPGHALSQTFTLPLTNAIAAQPASLISSVVSRSVAAPSSFTVSVDNQLVQQIPVPAVTAVYLDVFAREAEKASSFTIIKNNPTLTYTFLPGSFNAQGWLDRFQIFYRRSLSFMANEQLLFRDWNSVRAAGATFSINTPPAGAKVWDITNPFLPIEMIVSSTGGNLQFTSEAKTLHEYIAFANGFLTPQAIGKVTNQDLHATTETDYIIITYPLFLQQAKRLAGFHQQSNLRTTVVTTEQIFNEFSGGIPDPTALRDFVKLYYDRYKSTWTQSGKYLLLFGASSFDYKSRIANNTAFVPGYESVASLDPLATYTSDDFFGFLEDKEDINLGLLINELHIGIGRIPAKNEEEAKAFTDKVINYSTSFGPWRNNMNFIADDGDYNLHLADAETITATAQSVAPVFDIQKIYLDAYKKEGGSAGGQYPQVKEAINSSIYNGTLIWNYNGHGGPARLAEEDILDQQMVNNWNNESRLPLFITATCDFAPYDNPYSNSLGANLLLRPKTGAIALMTTTRVVFAFSNRIINNNYIQTALQRDSSGRYKTLGEAVQAAKNYTYNTSGDIINNRKFTLLGDPAMTIGFPQLNVKATAVNGRNITNHADTVSATQLVTIRGSVTDKSSNVLQNFNGTVYATLFDKVQTITTLGNDAASLPVPFQTQTNALFKGKVTAANGSFIFTFRVPKDINYQYGNGKLSLYAQDGTRDANSFSTNVIIGGITNAPLADKEGPVIKAYLNDDKFVSGSITNPAPVLILKLADSSGINTAGAGIGHDLVAVLDNDNKTYFTLNNFFESDLNSYQKGMVRFQLPSLPSGHHTLKIKAWDVLNNSSETLLDFIVVNTEALQIDHVLNYPNPFTTATTFWFEHNQPLTDLQVRIQIFTVSGKLIKTIHQTINNEGNRSSDVQWNGKDDFGNRVGRGVYIYRLSVQKAAGKQAQKIEKLIVL